MTLRSVSKRFGDVPVLDNISLDVTVFALNRHDTETMDLSMDLRGFGILKIASASELHHSDLKVANTREAPETVKPARLEGVSLSNGGLRATLKPLSWNVIALGV